MSTYFKVDYFTNHHPELKCKRNATGSMRSYTDGIGMLIAVYSYNTCIFARMPDGRPIYNRSVYSATTATHFRTLGAPSMWVRDAGKGIAHCDVIGLSRNVTASDLVRAVKAMTGESAANEQAA